MNFNHKLTIKIPCYDFIKNGSNPIDIILYPFDFSYNNGNIIISNLYSITPISQYAFSLSYNKTTNNSIFPNLSKS